MRGRTPAAPALQPSRRRRRAASAQARRRGACARQPPHRPRPLAAAASRCRFGGWVWPAGPAPPRQPTRGRGRGAAGACCPMRGRGAFGGSVGGGSRRHESHPARTGCCWPCCAARCSAAPRPRRPVSTARAPLRPGPPLPLPRAAAPRQREPGPPAAVAAASEPPGWTPPPHFPGGRVGGSGASTAAAGASGLLAPAPVLYGAVTARLSRRRSVLAAPPAAPLGQLPVQPRR